LCNVNVVEIGVWSLDSALCIMHLCFWMLDLLFAIFFFCLIWMGASWNIFWKVM
jgi:hypothetical protein